MYIFREIREIRKAVLGTKTFFYGFRVFQFFSSEITLKPTTICTCWIHNGLKFIFFYHGSSTKKILAILAPKFRTKTIEK